MGKGFKSGGSGGAAMNFKVVGGTTQPSDPKENTIWVNTDQKITSWVFSASPPAEPAEGMVWITVGASSTVEFNAIKKNTVMVYPLSAKQYVSGAWVDVTAKSYQNGSWSEWRKYLYNRGDTFDTTTGGWVAAAVYQGSNAYGPVAGKAVPIVSYTGTNMIVTSNGGCGLVHPENKIDLTDVKTLKLSGSILAYWTATASGIYIRSDAAADSYVSVNVACYTPATVGSKESGTFSVDVSGLTGEYYICLGVGEYNSNHSEIAMESMWLEG